MLPVPGRTESAIEGLFGTASSQGIEPVASWISRATEESPPHQNSRPTINYYIKLGGVYKTKGPYKFAKHELNFILPKSYKQIIHLDIYVNIPLREKNVPCDGQDNLLVFKVRAIRD